MHHNGFLAKKYENHSCCRTGNLFPLSAGDNGLVCQGLSAVTQCLCSGAPDQRSALRLCFSHPIHLLHSWPTASSLLPFLGLGFCLLPFLSELLYSYCWAAHHQSAQERACVAEQSLCSSRELSPVGSCSLWMPTLYCWQCLSTILQDISQNDWGLSSCSANIFPSRCCTRLTS